MATLLDPQVPLQMIYLLLEHPDLGLGIRKGLGRRLVGAESRSILAQRQTRLPRNPGANPEVV